jgi:hypothetical protein
MASSVNASPVTLTWAVTGTATYLQSGVSTPVKTTLRLTFEPTVGLDIWYYGEDESANYMWWRLSEQEGGCCSYLGGHELEFGLEGPTDPVRPVLKMDPDGSFIRLDRGNSAEDAAAHDAPVVPADSNIRRRLVNHSGWPSGGVRYFENLSLESADALQPDAPFGAAATGATWLRHVYAAGPAMLTYESSVSITDLATSESIYSSNSFRFVGTARLLPVPEPATLWLVGLALPLLRSRRR